MDEKRYDYYGRKKGRKKEDISERNI